MNTCKCCGAPLTEPVLGCDDPVYQKPTVSLVEITSLVNRANMVMDCDLSLADMQYLRHRIADLVRNAGMELTS